MLSPEKREKLRLLVEIFGNDYEIDIKSQSIRDLFPEGVPADEVLQLLKTSNRGDEVLQQGALRALAMVPVYGIEGEIIERLEDKLSLPKTKEVYLDIFSLSKSLLYLGHPRGMEEFEKLRAYCATFEEWKEPVPLHWFSSTLEDIDKWKRDRAAGKRWEIYQDDE